MSGWDAYALLVRAVMASVWLYNGLWLKLLARDPHHVAIVNATFRDPHLAGQMLSGIGLAEAALAIAILLGAAGRWVNGVQIVAVLVMNAVAIFFSGEIPHPLGLIVSNLPLVACALAIVRFGPGRFTFPSPREAE